MRETTSFDGQEWEVQERFSMPIHLDGKPRRHDIVVESECEYVVLVRRPKPRPPLGPDVVIDGGE